MAAATFMFWGGAGAMAVGGAANRLRVPVGLSVSGCPHPLRGVRIFPPARFSPVSESAALL